MIYALAGTNSYKLKVELKKLVNSFIEEYGDLALERLDGEETDLARVLDAVQSISFLSTKKMVVLRAASANKDIAEAIEQIISTSADSTELIFYEPAVDKRTSYYKTLKKLTQFNDLNQLDEYELRGWVKDYASQIGGQILTADAAFLIQRIGTDQQQLGSELDKLVTYDAQVNRQNIELLSEASPQSKIFDLLDAAFSSKPQKALGIYDEQRIQKIEPQQILAMIGWQLHALAIIKSAGSQSAETIASKAGMSPYVVRKTLPVANSLSLPRIKELVDEALDIDVKSKSSALNLDDALKTYILSI